MKITLVTNYVEITIEQPNDDDLTIEEVTQELVRPLLLAAGYHPDSVEDYIPSC